MNAGSGPRVFVALDFDDAAAALSLAGRLDPRDCGVKIGSELFTVAGPELVRAMVERRFNVFLDLKFHDIPNTVGRACAAATRLGVWMMNVHAAGGRAMLTAAREAVDRAAQRASMSTPRLIAVTVLTSLDDAALNEVGQGDNTAAQALRLAGLARDTDLDGVVCSAAEARSMRDAFGDAFLLVTPGIRPADAGGDDQSRIATPQAAIANGADYLVVGRPITRAADPVAALAKINRELDIER
ncbi:MAG TPA: orotidine-5'-phosphate decarboxylase [Casimicrobiaceae bacterium]